MVGATEFDTVERREAEMVGGPGVLPELGSWMAPWFAMKKIQKSDLITVLLIFSFLSSLGNEEYFKELNSDTI
jgi:hypothetical protein